MPRRYWAYLLGFGPVFGAYAEKIGYLTRHTGWRSAMGGLMLAATMWAVLEAISRENTREK